MPLAPEDATALRAHLVSAGLAADVETSPGNVLGNCGKVASGHVDYTFGLSDWRTATEQEVVAAVAELCGEPATTRDPDGPGWIDPDACVAAVGLHRDRLASFALQRGRVLLATGHPTGLLPHYEAIARALRAAGCEVLKPLDDVSDLMQQGDRKLGIRFLDGVACAFSGGELMHTHRSGLMEAMLAELAARDGLPDLVVGDHGMAGAAVERGIPALSIVDVNDPALILAQVRSRTDAVLPIDDNLAPSLFEPVTAAMLEGLSSPT